MVSKKVSTKKKSVAKKTRKVSTAKKKVQKVRSVKKKVVSRKKVTPKKRIVSEEQQALESLINTAQQEKKLYAEVPTKHRRKIRDLVKQCKNRGYVISEILKNHVPLKEGDCENMNDTWECIENIFRQNCIDIVDDSGLLGEISMPTDPRFPELDSSSYDSIQMYLRDIGRYPLLSAKEEQELGKKIVDRKNIIEKKTRKRLSPAERRRILAEGAEARNKLAVANLRLVVSIAKNYVGRSRNRDLGLLDLVQEGSEGLYKAVDKFEPERGLKFSTYATCWIKQSITRGLADKSRTIRIPVHMTESTLKYQKTVVQLEQSLGRTPTVQEIADEMGFEVDKIHRIRKTSQNIVQLEQSLDGSDEGSTTTVSETIEDLDAETQDSIVAQDILKNQVRIVLKDLSPRERQVIELRHGMGDGIQYTLEQIGGMMGVTRERVRQIEARALEKLRSHQVIKKMENY